MKSGKTFLYFTVLGIGLTNPVAGKPVNIALHKPYTFSIAPTYGYCTDATDSTNLTDGKPSPDWVNKATVGWGDGLRRKLCKITVDLGKVEPISGVGLGELAGTSDACWPASIAILVSEDGKKFYYVGDLWSLADDPLPVPYGQFMRHLFTTTKLQTRGRYVQLCIINTVYLFLDELEVYRGESAWVERPYCGKPADDKDLWSADRLTSVGVHKRIHRDLQNLYRKICESTLGEADKTSLLEEWKSIDQARVRDVSDQITARGFRAVVPVHSLHKKVLALYGRLLTKTGSPVLSLWKAHPDDVLDVFERPRSSTALSVMMMQNEVREDVLNLTSAGLAIPQVKLSYAGLPAGIPENSITVYQVEQADTAEGMLVRLPMVPLAKTAEGYVTTVPSGMTRQIWFSVDSKQIPPGNYAWKINVAADRFAGTVDFKLMVIGRRMPEVLDLNLTTWDYIYDKSYAVTAALRPLARRNALTHKVNVVWCTPHRGAGPIPDKRYFAPDGSLTQPINFDGWDKFVAFWPKDKIRHYLFFAAVPANEKKSYLTGFPLGSPAFQKAIKGWAKAWAEHNRKIGLKPGQVGVCFVDEPGAPEDYTVSNAYIKPFTEATKDVTVLTTNNFTAPQLIEGREHLRLADIYCPDRAGFNRLPEKDRQFYFERIAEGKQMWLYMCNATRLWNIAYYRLQPWHAWRYGATGSGFWSYGDVRDHDTWNEYVANGEITYSPLYFDTHRVYTSKFWEAVRAGAQDYQYLVMLRAKVAELKKQGTSTPSLMRAEKLLRGIAGETLDTAVKEYGDLDRTFGNPSRLADQSRIRVLTTLNELDTRRGANETR